MTARAVQSREASAEQVNELRVWAEVQLGQPVRIKHHPRLGKVVLVWRNEEGVRFEVTAYLPLADAIRTLRAVVRQCAEAGQLSRTHANRVLAERGDEVAVSLVVETARGSR